jgi:hypothetical protein
MGPVRSPSFVAEAAVGRGAPGRYLISVTIVLTEAITPPATSTLTM